MFRQSLLAGACVALVAGSAHAQEVGGEDRLPDLDAAAIQDLENTEDLVARSTAAQQMGNLATTKVTSGVVGDLGDVMVLLHSQILDRLQTEAERAEGLGEAAMPEDDRERLDELARENDQAFAAGFAEWVVEAYPGLIEEWQEVSDEDALGPLASAVIEQLEAQQEVARRIADAEGALDEVDDATRQTLSWGGGLDQGNVAQQPGDQADGVTTELPSEHEPGVENGEDGSLQADR